jgi:hypothetical protein
MTKKRVAVCLLAFFAVSVTAFSLLIYPAFGTPFLTQSITDNEVKVFFLFLTDEANSAEYKEKTFNAFFTRDGDFVPISDFFYRYSHLNFSLYMDTIENLDFDNATFPTFPFNAIQHYYGMINETQRAVVHSCNIFYTIYSYRTFSNPNSFSCIDYLFRIGEGERRYVLAHEICHWFGASDKYYSPNYSDSYDPDDEDNPYDLMSNCPHTLDSTIILGQRTLSEIGAQMQSWRRMGDKYSYPYYTPITRWTMDIFSYVINTTEKWSIA